MYIPDRVIARKVREYCKDLFILWNSRKEYWELWIHMPHGRRLVSPISESMYDPIGNFPHAFTPLDERLLHWIYASDSHRNRDQVRKIESNWESMERKKDDARFRDIYDRAKDAWHAINNFYATKGSIKKNPKPRFNHFKPNSATWTRPDKQSSINPRIFSRSAQNALKYNFRKT